MVGTFFAFPFSLSLFFFSLLAFFFLFLFLFLVLFFFLFFSFSFAFVFSFAFLPLRLLFHSYICLLSGWLVYYKCVTFRWGVCMVWYYVTYVCIKRKDILEAA